MQTKCHWKDCKKMLSQRAKNYEPMTNSVESWILNHTSLTSGPGRLNRRPSRQQAKKSQIVRLMMNTLAGVLNRLNLSAAQGNAQAHYSVVAYLLDDETGVSSSAKTYK
ncbi:hypothetical protein OUZ56_026776 [Daphnia magna]|uniref:Uncharacterized protein n=1 Tax=Daphnia magna TaxID=35525 RepID=A0ABQ9ZNK2_9CRUS|nr:hypothetical protein OUZ56_026776 [Daphnia magna]